MKHISVEPKEKKKKILIVDDQIFNINALFIILQHSVKIDTTALCDRAISGKLALKLVKDNISENT